MKDKYIIEYLGRTIYLNKDLIEKLDLTDKRVNDIKQLHRQIISCDISITKTVTSGGQAHLDFLLAHWERLQFDLQEAWGFTKDKRYHRFWELTSCNCPKADNEDSYPSGYYFISGKCALHGIENFWYTKNGECTEGYPEDGTIRLYYTKIGSPDARKIVAMLASNLRNYKQSNCYKEDTDYSAGWCEALETAYDEAKHLLGDINE